MDKYFGKVEGDLNEVKSDTVQLKDRVNNLTGLVEKVAQGIKDLKDEKAARDYQQQRERQWRAIITEVLLKHKILSPREFEKISKLNIL